jgi:hypothetical protein
VTNFRRLAEPIFIKLQRRYGLLRTSLQAPGTEIQNE